MARGHPSPSARSKELPLACIARGPCTPQRRTTKRIVHEKEFMRLGIQVIPSARQIVLAWAIIWFTSVPLFHTHLPTTDTQTSRAGVPHTVFSPDLPGEFFHVSKTDHGPFAHLSNWASHSPELGFVLSAWQTAVPDAISVISFLDRPFLSRSVVESQTVHRIAIIFAATRSPRAPPSLISL